MNGFQNTCDCKIKSEFELERILGENGQVL